MEIFKSCAYHILNVILIWQSACFKVGCNYSHSQWN